MGAKKRVPLHQNPRGFVEVDPTATEGAILGVNLRDSAGRVIRPEDVINQPTSDGGGTSSIASTIWKLIREIPANIQKLAALIGRGFAIRRDDGEWALRTLQPGDGIDIANGDGEDGDPTISLEDLADSGAGTLLAITRDGKGRVTGTRAATITGTSNQINVANGNAAAGVPTLSLATAVMISLSKADSAVQSVVAGSGIVVNNTDPRNPVISASGGGAVTSVNARTGAVVVPDFVIKATAPVAGDFGRAIIDGDRWFNSTNGVDYIRVAGAWVHDNAAALSRYMPAYLANGSPSPVPLNADGTVPAYLANGASSPFATQA